MAHLDPVAARSGALRLQQLPDARLVAHQDDFQIGLAHGGDDSLDLYSRGRVRAHRVNRDAYPVQGVSSSFGSMTRRSL